ncbi:oligosaccharide flippase family protein [Curtobacterium sp. CFBP9011]|uniref:oligosaccharide flippase family protein n=1 Tax=Curtobacterium sp. CFBP9011 TaxID=3096530 RepID=UPI002A698AC9|nr:oligosaccharide flippase family protein [Curtobacterium sp. CFBP9011]MDY1005546.1 oligosaccharide flippase family protein [Curtobacterium sp. CFBP9011]
MSGVGLLNRFGGGVRRVARHPSATLLASSAASTLFGLGTATLQARLLGPAGRGELAMAMVPAGIVAILLSFGLPDFAARRAAKGTDTRSLSRLALVAGVAIGLVAFFPYILLAGLQADGKTEVWWLFVAWAASVPLFVFGSTLTGVAIGSGRWLASAVVRALPGFAALVVLTALFFLHVDASPLLVGLILIATTVFSPLTYMVRRFARPASSFGRELIVDAAKFGARGWLAGATALVNQRIDLLMVSAIARPQEVGLYAVSTTLAATLNAVSNAVAMPNRNRVARGDVTHVARTCASTMLLIACLALVVAAAVPLLIFVLLGSAFQAAAAPMFVLLAAQVPLAGVVVLTQSLNGAGKPGKPLVGEVVALVTTAAMILLLFSPGGLVLAATATGVGNLLSLAVLIVLTRRHIQAAPIRSFCFIGPRAMISTLRSLR